ncbi:ubiE [Symbiodinium sp. CCMP2592]|nr:ubiE [Symbiodinium sp. CCMP2592]
MAARKLFAEAVKGYRWYHAAGAVATVGAVQGITLWGMSRTYHWFFAKEEERANRFIQKYGRPTESQRMDVYTWMAPSYDEGVQPLEKGIANKFRLELLRPNSLKGEVLEVAVGTGRCFEALEQSKEVRGYVGVDLNEAMLSVAREKLSDRPYEARVLRADGHKLPFSDNSFDAVFGSLCLCAMERPAVALDEIVRVCRPGGQILLLEPGVANRAIVRWAQEQLALVPSPTHEWEFGYRDDTDVNALMRSRTDLEVKEIQTRGMGNWYLVWARKPQPE